jgi:hypothetical protein
MRRLLVFAAIVLSCGTVVLGLGMNYPNDRPIPVQPEWPAGLGELANSAGRVNGYMVNANDWVFFAGDAKAFNAFLEPYAKLKDMPLVLVLHPGRGLTGGLGEDPKTPYDWRLDIIRRGWGADMPDAYKNSSSQYVLTVHLMLGGNIRMDDLDVPLEIEVQSGHEIERFVITHDAKRQLVEQAKKESK